MIKKIKGGENIKFKNKNLFLIISLAIFILGVFSALNGICAEDMNNIGNIATDSNITNSLSILEYNSQLSENKNINNNYNSKNLANNELNENTCNSNSEIANTLTENKNNQSNQNKIVNINSDAISRYNNNDTRVIYISTNGNDVSGDGSLNNPYQSIQKAVNQSNSGDTIYLDNGIYNGANNRNITINKDLTISSQNSDENSEIIIDGEQLDRIFLINENINFNLIGLTITNAYGVPGGAILSNGNLNIKNTTIKNSNGENRGGAIYTTQGSLTVANSQFYNNTAIHYGGAIYSEVLMDIENCTFEMNTVTGSDGVGAGLCTRGQGLVNNTKFNNNPTSYSASGLINTGNLTINNCSFTNGTGPYGGGAFSNHGYIFMNNSYVADNSMGTFGGAFLVTRTGSMDVYNTIIKNNHAGMHGAVLNSYASKNLKFSQCAFLGNYLGDVPKNPGISYGDITADGPVNLTNCWWGINNLSPNYDSGSLGELNASTWLLMNLSSSDNLTIGKTSILKVDLKHYYDNKSKTIKEIEGDMNLPLTVNFYTNNGEIANSTLVNGTATISYTPSNNIETIYAKLNNQILSLNLSKSPAIYLDLVSNSNNITIKANETFNLTFNLINNGTAIGNNIKINLINYNTSSLKVIALSVDGKEHNYTINKENLTINFDELAIGNKTIILSLKALETGNYLIQTNLSGDFSNLNNTLNISINSISNNTNSSNNTNKTNNTTNPNNNTNTQNNTDNINQEVKNNDSNLNSKIASKNINLINENSSNENGIAMEKSGNPLILALFALLSLIPINLRKRE